MSMRIVFLKDYDGYKKDQDCYIERSLAKRYCEKEIALPGVVYDDLKKVVDPKVEEEAPPIKEEVVETEPENPPEPDAAEMKTESEAKEETTESKPVKKRTKATTKKK